jgi:hypothetical protein
VLDVTDTSLPQAELQSLAEEAHEKICPYSHATRGNVDVKVVTHGASSTCRRFDADIDEDHEGFGPS